MNLSRLSKVLAAGALAALLLAAFPTRARAERSPFTDLPADHWAYEKVHRLVKKGILTGYPDGSFRGNNLVTRYALAVSLAKAMEDGLLSGNGTAPGAPGGTGSTLDLEDIDVLERLIKEFGEELALVGVKTAAIEERLQAHGQAIDELRYKVNDLETRRKGDDEKVRFVDGRLRGLGYNKSNLNGSLDTILNLGVDISKDVDAVIGLRYRNIFDQVDNETFGTYEAYLRSKHAFGPIDEGRLGKFNNFLGSGMVLYGLREGIELKSKRQDVNFELSYFDALLAHVSTEILNGGRLGFYFLKQDSTAGREPLHLGVYARGEAGKNLEFEGEFTEYDHDGKTLTNRNSRTTGIQFGLNFKPSPQKDLKLRLGYIVQEEDFRALEVDSDLRWQFPGQRVSPHHDVLQAIRDATPAGVDPNDIPGFRDLQLGVQFGIPNSVWRARFGLDLLRGHSSALNHGDDDMDIFTMAVDRSMGDDLELELRFQGISFDNQNGAAVVDGIPTLRRRDTSNFRAQLVKRF